MAGALADACARGTIHRQGHRRTQARAAVCNPHSGTVPQVRPNAIPPTFGVTGEEFAWRAPFVLTIPTLNPDVSSPKGAPQLGQSGL